MQIIKNRAHSLGTFSQLLRRGFVATSLCSVLAGCGGGPVGYAPPTFDPVAASEQALHIYDTDKDGFVAGEELERASGLKAGIKTFDADGDGKISGDEIAERVRAWDTMKIGVTDISAQVSMDGQPLEGAIVTFDPEEFQGGATQAAVGTTSVLGIAFPSVPKENRPSPQSPPGIQPGLYKVRISKLVNGKETIPPQYNSETIFGQQVAQDDPAIIAKQVVFKLKRK